MARDMTATRVVNVGQKNDDATFIFVTATRKV